MSVFSRALEVAFVSLGETFLTTLAGSVAILAGYLDSHSLRRISTFMVKLLFPCLMLSLFTSFDTERLSRWSPVLLVALLHILLGALLALITTRLLRLPAQHSRLLILSAAFGNSGEVLNVLMSAGAAVDARESSQGATALHFAAFGNHTDAVRLLHEGGAAMDATDGQGATALHTAVSRRPASNAGPPASRSSD